MLIVVAALALVPSVLRSLRALPARLWLAYAGIGALVALHWLTFYGAIKLANASVAATCIALAAPFTALVEPWLTRTRFSARDLLLGLPCCPASRSSSAACRPACATASSSARYPRCSSPCSAR